MVSQRILVVEDDHELRTLLARGLRSHGFDVVTAVDGQAALRSVDLAPDAVILDIGLPDSDGRDVCQALRSRGVDAPVIFLTARREVHDRLVGFASGGDDYLTKPFSFLELMARLQALLRRHVRAGGPVTDKLQVDPVAHCLVWSQNRAELSPIEYKLLARLLVDDMEVVRRQQLREVGWPHGAIVSDNTLDQYLSKLRRKLVDVSAPYAIRSSRGVGYQVVPTR
ncbi:response regulator transcription factor [uncultured Jatrophihabitans sp.]|uniref:response regulator transcription factor n=1 Tax=uncultured Jatrophihabitans sp. TaxID=1610747 RepID=UPI0035CAF70D